MDPTNRPPRNVAIADHIWDAFEAMARSMGSDRDALINQAMFMFARLNGFLDPGDGVRPAVSSPERATPVAPLPVARSAPAASAAQVNPPPLSVARSATPASTPTPAPVALAAAPAPAVPQNTILPPPRSKEPTPAPSIIGEIPGPPGLDFASAEHIADADAAPAADPGGLFLVSTDGELRVAKDRFVIGRGKHCDFVIDSGKVSREHAALIREGDHWFIEDLGSSNGTWFNKERIKRRRVADGDEYLVCSERIRFSYR